MSHSNSNLWDAEWEVSVEAAARLIGSQFPALASRPVQRLDHGWDNTVYRVGDEYVFRFPRREVAVASLRMEGQILPQLEAYIQIPYSKPLFHGEGDRDYPLPFLGYPYLPGAYPIGLTDEQRALSAGILAQFLKGLHAFPVEIARENGVQADHRNLADIAARIERMQGFLSKLTPHIEAQDRLAIAGYLDRLPTGRVRPCDVFLHGDLHFKNIVVDETGLVAGVIDWGDINIGHPACDLSIAYSYLPPHARPAFFQTYGPADEETRRLARLIAVYIPMLIWMQAIEDRADAIAEEARSNILRALAD
ncbi:phosphotransferase [Cohnella nanjingensis]|uniref:Phosphotransferase n=1 Tax=Cohnella nanjingensis TaxID=1387779 RepID=A0A7X0RW06_9BACL|nr:phosphotransferase [Cohnella nanjingensis]MBB6674673.1 phosphotransferase [Cohnella nanjingensis]